MDAQLAGAMNALSREISQIAAAQARLERGQRTNGLGNSSIDGGALLVKDTDGTVRQILGAQPDGSVTITDVNAPPAQPPDAPTVAGGVLGLYVLWDGSLGGADPLADFQWCEVHVSTVDGFTPGTTTLQGHLAAPGVFGVGGLTAGTTYYVKLVAVNTSKVSSDPSAQASAVPLSVPEGIPDGGITTGLIAPGAITAGLLAAKIILASDIIAGTDGGPGVLLSSVGLVGIDATGAETFRIDAASGAATFTGTIVMTSNVGEFLAYAGGPAAGNLVASLSVSGGTDANGNVYIAGFQMGVPGGSQVAVIPAAGVPFGTGILQAVTEYTTSDAGEMLPAFAGAVLLNQGAANQQPATAVTSPAGSDGKGAYLLLSGDSDDATSAGGISLGSYVTDGQSVNYAELVTVDAEGRMIKPGADLYYGASQTPVTETWTKAGTYQWTCPAGVTSIDVITVGAGGGGAAGINDNAAGGGAGGGEFAEEPATAVTPGDTYTITVGAAGAGSAAAGTAGGDGGNSAFAADTVTVTAHGGRGGGTNGPVPYGNGVGGTGSTNTRHFDGGFGSAGTGGSAAYMGGGGGGGAGSGAGTGGGGGHSSVSGGGAGGTSRYGAGGVGGYGSGNGGYGRSPGGAGGGGGAEHAIYHGAGGNGADGMVAITYTPPVQTLVAAVAGMAGTDPSGHGYAAGHTGPVTAFQPGSSPAVPETWHPVTMASGWAGNSTITGDANLQVQRVASPPGAVAIMGTFSRSGTTWANGAQIATMDPGYYNTAVNQYVTISWGVSPSSSFGMAGMLRIDNTGKVTVYITGSGGGVNGNVFWVDGTYYTA